MRLDNLKNYCKKEYGTTSEAWESAIADYQFESARADIDDETTNIIKKYCEISATSSTPVTPSTIQALPDPRVDTLIAGYQQVISGYNKLAGVVQVQGQTIKQLKAEMVALKQTAGEVIEGLIKELDQLKEEEQVTPVPALPSEFAGFEMAFN